MKFTVSALRRHLDIDAPVERIADTLSAIGLEVEAIHDPAASLRGFVVGRVVTATPHPDADRLRVCAVDIGADAPVQVVCGAPNARAGLVSVFAAPGTVIPATGAVLKTGTIRGVESRGMLCSTRELGLGEEHDGIAELADGLAPGAPFAAIAGLDDPVIDIAVTPNRGDALAVRGVARDLAAAGLGRLRFWRAPAIASDGSSLVQWALEDAGSCPWILGRTVRGVRNGPSPDWLQRWLRAVGLRPISALVDITNFFTLDLGRPLHVFDADLVAGGVLTLRRGRPGERFAALNGDEVAVGPDDAVFADANGVQSLAGIMGGSATGSGADTRNVFIECALFDPVRIAETGRRVGIASDARQRFERGIDPSLLPASLDAAAAMVVELCGGTPSAVAAAGAEPVWRREATLRFERLGGFGGLALAPDEAVARLERLGFAVASRDAAGVTVAVPPWRNDVAGATPLEPAPVLDEARAAALAPLAARLEAECDLVEEVLRLGGLDAVPPVSLPAASAVPLPALAAPGRLAAAARRALAGRGLLECVSFSFMAGTDAARFAPADADKQAVTLLNPIASDLDRLRPTPLASLLVAGRRNAARGGEAGALFEIGPGFDTDGGAALIGAGLRTGHTARLPGTPSRPFDWSDVRADVLAVLAGLGAPVDALTTERVAADERVYHPGQGGVIKQGPRTVLARFGTLHPALLASSGVEVPAAGFELFLDAITVPARKRRGAAAPPNLQPLSRDFAFVVDEAVAAETVLRAARSADRALIGRATLFDVYRGAGVSDGRKSLAIAVTLQPTECTLTDGDIEAVSQRVLAAVRKAVPGALLRS